MKSSVSEPGLSVTCFFKAAVSLQSGIQCFVNDRLISRVERKWKYSEFFYHNSVDQAYMTQPKPCFFSSLLGRRRFWDSDDE